MSAVASSASRSPRWSGRQHAAYARPEPQGHAFFASLDFIGLRSESVAEAAGVPWFVYVARCADGTLYVGVARDVKARIAQHDAGRGARYTRGRGPLAVLATRRCTSQGDALRLEMALKRLPREEKLVVIASPRKLAAVARACVARV
jgi:putative endonuclease